jgi:hypothetical protein
MQFQAKSIVSVQIVSKHSFGSNEAKILVQLQSRLVGDFGFQHNLNFKKINGGSAKGLMESKKAHVLHVLRVVAFHESIATPDCNRSSSFGIHS